MTGDNRKRRVAILVCVGILSALALLVAGTSSPTDALANSSEERDCRSAPEVQDFGGPGKPPSDGSAVANERGSPAATPVAMVTSARSDESSDPMELGTVESVDRATVEVPGRECSMAVWQITFENGHVLEVPHEPRDIRVDGSTVRVAFAENVPLDTLPGGASPTP